MMNSARSIHTSLTLLFFFGWTACLAQKADTLRKYTPFDSLKKAYLLEEVTINHLPAEKSLTVPYQRLSGARLENLQHLSLADALRYFSGIQLKDYGGVGGLKTINVRSLGTQHTQVFYDGIAISNAQNGQVDLGRLSLENVEALSLFQAQNSGSLQAAKAYAGSSAIYISPKAPRLPQGKPWSLRAKLKGGSFGLISPELSTDVRLSPNITSRLSLGYVNAHGRYTFRYTNGSYDTTARRSNTDVESFRLEAGLYGKQPAGNWSLSYYHYQSKRGLPGAIVSNRFDYNQRLWDNNDFLQASFQKNLSASYRLAVRAKLAQDYSRYMDPEYIQLQGPLDNRYTQNQAYVSVANEFQLLPFWQLSLAADYQQARLRANLFRFAYPQRRNLWTALSSKLSFQNVSIQGHLLYSGSQETVQEQLAADNHHALSPALIINYKPSRESALSFRGFYKHSFRLPNFNDLYYTFVGNTALRPEYTHQYNLGFSFQPLNAAGDRIALSWQADAYYNRVSDKIIALPSANLFRWTMVNLGSVSIKGLETAVNLQYRLQEQLRLSMLLNYTYQRATDRQQGAQSFGHQIPYTPLHSGSLSAGLQGSRAGLDYSFIYTGERYSQKTNQPSNYLQPWYTHDLAAWYRFSLQGNQARLGAAINNLLNQHYDVILNFPMPGRNYQLSLTVEI